MRIVIDTNVVISGTFFGGTPRKVLEAVYGGKADAYASPEILEEYQLIVDEMIDRKQGHLRRDVLSIFSSKLHVIESNTDVNICRDPDDDKFLSCAIDAKAVYIVSGDKDLLEIKEYEGIEIITANDFCLKYL